MRFKVGDRVRVVAAKAITSAVDQEYTVQYVGPWKAGERQPNGGMALKDCDYILEELTYQENPMYAPGITCREANIEPAGDNHDVQNRDKS